MKIDFSEIGRTLIVSIEGNFDMYSTKEFEEKFQSQWDILKYNQVAFHFGNLKSIDSSGIGAFLRIGNQCKKDSKEAALIEVPKPILDVIKFSGLNQFYSILSGIDFENKFIQASFIHTISYRVKNRIVNYLFNSKSITKWAIFGVIVLFYIASIAGVEYYTFHSEKGRVSELATFLRSYVWDMDDKNAKEFADILTETKGYELIRILHSDGTLFIESKNDGTTGIVSFFRTLNLVRSVDLNADIFHKNEKIGVLHIVWTNTNIFIHMMNGVLFLLIYSIITSYIKIVQSQKELNEKNIEIVEKMEEVQKLKSQQDGDYYLTSLLTKPLSNIQVYSDKIKIQKLVKQKKKFEFRKKTDEIGGDICISDRILLRGQSYIVFVNADAMGKSLQGAGGVLVFGSAFNSILMRNKHSSSAQNLFPEVWLKNAFVDIHKVFETFGGSMLISCVIGLIDEHSNFMYWMNAEHPGLVLYRDGKASLLDTDDIFMKLGTEGVSKTLKVNCMQLAAGDIVFAGSDGRDDLIIGKDETGHNILNNDEELFLKNVESAHGDLEKIYSNIKSTGEISDDLSLMRIEFLVKESDYLKNTQVLSQVKQAKKFFSNGQKEHCEDLLLEILEQTIDYPDALKLIIRVYFERKDFVKICKYIDRYVAQRPEDSEMIYLASYAYKHTGSLKMGIAYGERYKLRFPYSVKNLLNLYDLYQTDKNYEKSLPLLDQILMIEPNNARAISLKGGHFDEKFEV